MSDKISLMPHQHIHSWKLDNTPFSGIAIFDDVGTGKTISSLNIVNKYVENNSKPVLILIPPALFDKWQSEIRKWCNKKVNFSTISNGILNIKKGINILSHGALQSQKLSTIPEIGLLIIDEAHHFRNPETISSKYAFGICRSSENRVIMTATPLQNGINDLVTILNLVLCDIPSPVINAVVIESLGTGNGEILYPLITRCILNNNHNKRVINNHNVRMSEREKQYNLELINSYRGKQLSKIMIMKMAASSMATIKKFTGHDVEIDDSKIEYTASMINDFCKNGRKVIVFSEYIETARVLSSKVEEYLIGMITGETPPDSRTAFLTGLEYSQGGVIVMTDVGGEGLDMQFVDAVVNHDLPWNPMILEQRIGRLDRIGRDERNVEVHNIILDDSLDLHISYILLEKEKLTSKFGGYGISVDIEKDRLIADTAFNFKSLTSEVFQNDAIGCSTRNLEYLNKKIQDLESILEDLV